MKPALIQALREIERITSKDKQLTYEVRRIRENTVLFPRLVEAHISEAQLAEDKSYR